MTKDSDIKGLKCVSIQSNSTGIYNDVFKLTDNMGSEGNDHNGLKESDIVRVVDRLHTYL